MINKNDKTRVRIAHSIEALLQDYRAQLFNLGDIYCDYLIVAEYWLQECRFNDHLVCYYIGCEVAKLVTIAGTGDLKQTYKLLNIIKELREIVNILSGIVIK